VRFRYDMDLVDEEAFVKWNGKASKQVSKSVAAKIRSKAKPFIEWLQEVGHNHATSRHITSRHTPALFSCFRGWPVKGVPTRASVHCFICGRRGAALQRDLAAVPRQFWLRSFCNLWLLSVVL
jgi:hypothetical protein